MDFYNIFSLTVALPYFLSHQNKYLQLVMSERNLIMMSVLAKIR